MFPVLLQTEQMRSSRNSLRQHKQISLIAESERRGKSAAINKFIAAATTDLLIIESGDTIPAADTVEKMITPYLDQSIGMTGGRPVPENPDRGFVGYSVNLIMENA